MPVGRTVMVSSPLVKEEKRTCRLMRKPTCSVRSVDVGIKGSSTKKRASRAIRYKNKWQRSKKHNQRRGVMRHCTLNSTCQTGKPINLGVSQLCFHPWRSWPFCHVTYSKLRPGGVRCRPQVQGRYMNE
ncbi:hypothetical protein BHE74_00023508 [Ensete ventricosum]|nr:hypothetical protein BHE74_00023508 [Ensete ventricosum]RZS01919.1 hypothetical protein BHM03_00031883 [Ensete ventricosum]